MQEWGKKVHINRRSFYDFLYLIGGHPYSLSTIKNGILRSNRRSPYSLVKPLRTADPRLELALLKMNPLIHFGICNGTKSSPKLIWRRGPFISVPFSSGFKTLPCFFCVSFIRVASGQIPAAIGKLKKLETLDLSNNTFSGEIPSSLESLTNLNYL
ncbi:hypothetical protein PIB30_014835 [Stylosanthes scabra]|uniref:DUF547 domain-containing protein n=1 Tax=Stylosanthes scabra TaxID=79078 RepID=A0ABU6R761_9FABA|nr:hypothetical protein [Stylosanthes scabra]